MGRKQITVRLSPSSYEFIAEEASREGVSFAAYVTEAAIARAAYAAGERGNPEWVTALQAARHHLTTTPAPHPPDQPSKSSTPPDGPPATAPPT